MDVLQSRRDGHEAHRLGEEALPRVIVVGGGFGGLAAVRRLRNQAVRVSWIARDNYHLFQPLLYQVATGALSPADIAAPLRAIVRGCRNIDVILDEVVDIDAERRTVRTARQSFTYDYLVVATGAETSYFGNDGWARHANGLKTLEEAIAIRSKILLCLELAETSTSEDVRRPLLTFVPTSPSTCWRGITPASKQKKSRSFSSRVWISSCRASPRNSQVSPKTS